MSSIAFPYSQHGTCNSMFLHLLCSISHGKNETLFTGFGFLVEFFETLSLVNPARWWQLLLMESSYLLQQSCYLGDEFVRSLISEKKNGVIGMSSFSVGKALATHSTINDAWSKIQAGLFSPQNIFMQSQHYF